MNGISAPPHFHPGPLTQVHGGVFGKTETKVCWQRCYPEWAVSASHRGLSLSNTKLQRSSTISPGGRLKPGQNLWVVSLSRALGKWLSVPNWPGFFSAHSSELSGGWVLCKFWRLEWVWILTMLLQPLWRFLRNTCWYLNASHHQCFIEHNLANTTLKVFMNLSPKRARYQYISYSLGRFYWYFPIHHTKPSFSMAALFLSPSLSLSFFLFIYLTVPGLICSSQDLQSSLQHAGSCFCGMWYLVPWLGIEPGLPALEMWNLSLWI